MASRDNNIARADLWNDTDDILDRLWDGLAPGGDEVLEGERGWEEQPRVPAGNPDGGEWGSIGALWKPGASGGGNWEKPEAKPAETPAPAPAPAPPTKPPAPPKPAQAAKPKRSSAPSAAAISKCRAFENKVVNEKREYLAVYDDDGKQIYTMMGSRRSAGIDTSLIESGAIIGTTITHNHPNIRQNGITSDGGSFSPPDIAVGLFSGSKAIRAVSGQFEHQVVFNQKGRMTRARAQDLAQQYERMLNESDDKLRAEISQKIRSGKLASYMSGSEYAKQYRERQHQVMEKFAKANGFTYTRKKRK